MTLILTFISSQATFISEWTAIACQKGLQKQICSRNVKIVLVYMYQGFNPVISGYTYCLTH